MPCEPVGDHQQSPPSSRARHIRELASAIMNPRVNVSRKSVAALALTGALAAVTAAPAPALAAAPASSGLPGKITIGRDSPARTISFSVRDAGESVIDFTAAAPGVSWGGAGAESAVVAV